MDVGGEARQSLNGLLVWEGSDLRSVYADTEKGRVAAERLRANIQAVHDEFAIEKGVAPRRYSWISVDPTRVTTGEEALGE